MKDIQILYCDIWLPTGRIMDCLSEVTSSDKVILRDLFQEELKSKSNLRDEINKYLNEGKPVPTYTVEKLISRGISNTKCFLLTGYPRTVEQFESFLKFCSINKIRINKLWYFKTEDFGDILNDDFHFKKLTWSDSEIDEHKRKQLSDHDNFRKLITTLLTYSKEAWSIIELNKDEFLDHDKILVRIKNSGQQSI